MTASIPCAAVQIRKLLRRYLAVKSPLVNSIFEDDAIRRFTFSSLIVDLNCALHNLGSSWETLAVLVFKAGQPPISSCCDSEFVKSVLNKLLGTSVSLDALRRKFLSQQGPHEVIIGRVPVRQRYIFSNEKSSVSVYVYLPALLGEDSDWLILCWRPSNDGAALDHTALLRAVRELFELEPIVHGAGAYSHMPLPQRTVGAGPQDQLRAARARCDESIGLLRQILVAMGAVPAPLSFIAATFDATHRSFYLSRDVRYVWNPWLYDVAGLNQRAEQVASSLSPDLKSLQLERVVRVYRQAWGMSEQAGAGVEGFRSFIKNIIEGHPLEVNWCYVSDLHLAAPLCEDFTLTGWVANGWSPVVVDGPLHPDRRNSGPYSGVHSTFEQQAECWQRVAIKCEELLGIIGTGAGGQPMPFVGVPLLAFGSVPGVLYLMNQTDRHKAWSAARALLAIWPDAAHHFVRALSRAFLLAASESSFARNEIELACNLARAIPMLLDVDQVALCNGAGNRVLLRYACENGEERPFPGDFSLFPDTAHRLGVDPDTSAPNGTITKLTDGLEGSGPWYQYRFPTHIQSGSLYMLLRLATSGQHLDSHTREVEQVLDDALASWLESKEGALLAQRSLAGHEERYLRLNLSNSEAQLEWFRHVLQKVRHAADLFEVQQSNDPPRTVTRHWFASGGFLHNVFCSFLARDTKPDPVWEAEIQGNCVKDSPITVSVLCSLLVELLNNSAKHCSNNSKPSVSAVFTVQGDPSRARVGLKISNAIDPDKAHTLQEECNRRASIVTAAGIGGQSVSAVERAMVITEALCKNWRRAPGGLDESLLSVLRLKKLPNDFSWQEMVVESSIYRVTISCTIGDADAN